MSDATFSVNTMRQAAYELYKTDWLHNHISLTRNLQTQREYILALVENDFDEEYDYAEYLFENGYQGELYVCFDEFLHAEYTDAEYMHNLLGNELFTAYKNIDSLFASGNTN